MNGRVAFWETVVAQKLPGGCQQLPDDARRLSDAARCCQGAPRLQKHTKLGSRCPRRLPDGVRRLPNGARRLPDAARRLPGCKNLLNWGPVGARGLAARGGLWRPNGTPTIVRMHSWAPQASSLQEGSHGCLQSGRLPGCRLEAEGSEGRDEVIGWLAGDRRLLAGGCRI